MSRKDVEIEWFDDKFECNKPVSNLQVIFASMNLLGNEDESKERIVFMFDKFYNYIQKYEYAMLGFDRDLGIMAIKLVEYKIPGAYKMFDWANLLQLIPPPKSLEASMVLVTPEQFLIEFGLKHSETTAYQAEFDEEKQMLLVAIDKDKLVKTSE
ncbi:hypothetical protein LCGC14_1823720 [marine sediment metagenome]|uniref:Uncharacterized protein n=1 Tax=marine sediment metagenome TaxID=412755 RepID=A0A0F9H6C4_9ZZZZ